MEKIDIDKLPIIKKCWEVYCKQDFHFYREGDGEHYFAKTAGQAKLKYSNYSDAGFVNVKVRRAKYGDLVVWDGKEIRRNQIEALEKAKKLKADILALPDDQEYYIQDKRSFHGNAVVWWAKNSNGYTSNIDKAERYSKEYILKHFNPPRESDRIWFASHIDNVKPIKIIDSQYINYDYSI